MRYDPRRQARQLLPLKKAASLVLLFSFIFPTSLFAQEAPSEEKEEQSSSMDSAENSGSEDSTEVEEPVDEEGIGPIALSSFSNGSALSYLANNAEERNSVPEADQLSGTLAYSYPLTVPPGRNGLQPELSLSYSSRDTSINNILGQGWKVDIPYIQRINRLGTESLYSTSSPYFYSSVSGELATTSVAGTFYAKSDNGSFIKYVLTGNQWIATDKEGVTYKYGYATSTRQDDSTGARVYKWMLEEARDTNDNYVRYEYTKDNGQIYPDAIYYTGSGVSDGAFKVEFTKALRTDISTSTEAGFDIVSKYRLTKAQARVSGQIVRVYDLTYGTGDNGVKSLLASVTESGVIEGGATTTLPALTFSYGTASRTFTEDSGYEIPEYFVDGSSDKGVRFADVNGDAYPDLLRAAHSGPPYYNRVYLNDHDGTGWTLEASSTLPEYFIKEGSDQGVRFADINGDNYVDILRSFSDAGSTVSQKAYINNQNLSWSEASTTIPEYFTYGSSDRGTRLADVNGDGYADIVRSYHNDSGGTVVKVYINDRSDSITWTHDTDYSVPIYFTHDNSDLGVRLVDVNADGLVDIVQSRSGGYQAGEGIYINKGDGTGWALDPTWNIPSAINVYDSVNPGVRFTDINADGLIDWVKANAASQGVYLNTGKGFALDAGYAIPYIFYDGSSDKGVLIEDINADGLPDFVQSIVGWPNPQRTSLHDGVLPDLLTDIDYPAGGSTEIAYKASTQYEDESGDLLNPSATVLLPTVESITHADDIGSPATETYEYAGGDFYYGGYLDRKFAGFNSITKTDASGFTTTNYFHQGNSSATTTGEYDDVGCKIGKIYRTEIADDDDIYSTAVNKWDKVNFDSGRCFVKLAQSTQLDYDGDADHKDKATTYAYNDTNGNLSQEVAWGVVTGATDGSFSDTGSDKLTTGYMYAASSTGYLMGLESQASTTNQSGTKIQETRRYYDNQALGTVTKGNETKTEEWRTASSYASSTQAFNSYGLVTTSTDPRSYTTSYDYDGLNLYPATTTNPLSQTIAHTYDYSSGKVKVTTDPNNRQFEMTYDGLDRPLLEKQPDIASPGSLVTKKAYTYTDTSSAKSVLETNYLDGSTDFRLYTFFDGLDRKLQERKEAETSNQFSVRDIKYNGLGLLWKESLPYFSNGTSRTTATGNNSLYATYEYDPMKRVTSVTTAVGETTNEYDQWSVTTTDPENNEKDFTYDAFDNLVEVVEHNSGSYTTAYEYDGNNNLTEITDANGNIRNFTYDGLNRRLTAADLHDSGDGTFGTWTYGYDDAGNLTSQTDSKSQTVNFTYDGLGRVLTEDYTGQAGTEVVYGYDFCSEGKGRLCAATTTAAATNLSYNALGLSATERKTVSGADYTTAYSYDRQGNQTNIVYPDSSEVRYAYNTAGLLEGIDQKESGGSFATVVSDFDYAPTENVTFKQFSSGVETTYTYAASSLYRLTNIRTVFTGGDSLMGGGEGSGEELSYMPDSLYAFAPFGLWSQTEFVPEEPVSLEPVLDMTSEVPMLVDEPVLAEEPQPMLEANTTPPVATTTEPVIDTPEILPEPIGVASTTEEIEELIVPVEDSLKLLPVDAAELRLKASPDKLLGSLETDGLVKYAYRTDTKVDNIPAGEATVARARTAGLSITREVAKERTKYSRTFATDQFGTFIAEFVSGDPQYYEDEHGEWWLADYGVTTKSSYDYQIEESKKVEEPTIIEAAIDAIVSFFTPQRAYASTGIFYPDPDTETSSVDGWAYKYDSTDWSGTRGAGSGTTANDSSTTNTVLTLHGTPAGSTRKGIQRSFLLFNTASIPDTAVIATTTLSIYILTTAGASNKTVYVVSSAPASTTAVTVNDYGSIGDTSFGTSDGSYSNGTYESITLNATGKAAVSKTGVSQFALRTHLDFDNSNVSNGTEFSVDFSASETSGTGQDPYLSVIYSIPPDAPSSLLAEGQTNPVDIIDNTPEFSAIYQDSDAGNLATHYQIQVSTTTTFATTTWDTGKTSLGSSTPSGMRIADISYAGPTLASTTTHYWRMKFWDSDGLAGDWSSPAASFSLQLWFPPFTPSNLQTDGQTNPANLENLTPDFSAIYNDLDGADLAASYQIQVSTSTDWSSPKWDSGKLSVGSSTPIGQRVNGMPYTGTALVPETTYHWRVKFWDNHDTESAWSTTTATFGQGILPEITTIQDLYFFYDDVGNISEVRDYSGTGAGKKVVYQYDDLYRLTLASTTAASSTPFRHVYEYTAIGNLSSSTPAGAYTYAETGFTNPHGPTSIGGLSLTHDNNGNLTAYGSETYTWDYRNRLATSTNGTPIGYAYDYLGERVRKATGVATTTYPNKFYNADATTKTKHIFTPSGDLVATFTTVGATTERQYLHGDQLGGSTVSTDESGAVSEVTDYYPYGAERIATGSFEEQRKFATMERDYESGLDYAKARYYQTTYGQFLSQDPVFMAVGNKGEVKGLTKIEQSELLKDPQSFNSYSYARNNPIRYSDPEGLWYKEVLTGEQSLGDFQIEVGQATQQLTQDSAVWNVAVSNPETAGVGVGVVSAAAAIPATAAIAGITTIQAGVGAMYVAGKIVAGATYSYVAKNSLESLPNVVSAYAKISTQDSSTWVSPVVETAKTYLPNSIGETGGAIYDIADSVVNLVKDVGLEGRSNNNEN